MVDGAPTSEPSKEPTQHEELPDRLRVHQLARSLGNTNKEVLDALFELDGQARNVQSGVDREDALRVRDLLFAKAPAVFPASISAAVTAKEVHKEVDKEADKEKDKEEEELSKSDCDNSNNKSDKEDVKYMVVND